MPGFSTLCLLQTGQSMVISEDKFINMVCSGRIDPESYCMSLSVIRDERLELLSSGAIYGTARAISHPCLLKEGQVTNAPVHGN